MKIVLAFLVLLAAFAGASGIVDANAAADMVFSDILSGNITGRTVMVLDRVLPEGSIVETWHEEVTVPMDAYLVFIDDMAYANWEHPCRWVFVGLNGDTEIVRMMTPPNALERMTVTHTCLPQADGKGQYEDFIAWFTPNVQSTPANAEHMYAWIISGGANQGNNHTRYYGDVQFIYNVLARDYLIPDDHIIVCFSDGLNPAPDLSNGLNSNPDFDDDGDSDIIYDATAAGVTSGYNAINAMVGATDHLFIFTTDHGGSGKIGFDDPPEVYLNLWNTQQLDDDTFMGYMDSFSSMSSHVVMEQCYSGGFLEEVVNTGAAQPRTFASAANAYESSWAGATYPEYDEYVYYWTGAMHGSTPPATSVPGGSLPGDPDMNSDGYVSMYEAAYRAEEWDTYAQSGQEHPMWDDTPDSCGDTYWLGGIISVGIGGSEYPVLPAGGLTITGNPVSSASTIVFNLGSPGEVEISVYDMSGHMVENLLSDEFAAGQHSVNWSADGLAAGVYIVRLTAGDIIESVRAVKF